MSINIKLYLIAILGFMPALQNGHAEKSHESNPEFAGVTLRAYLERAQEFNPEIKAFEKFYQAALHRIPIASSLPDPKLQITNFIESVQTRTGPQENVLMINQSLPWFGTLNNRERASSSEAEAVWFAYQSKQLSLARLVSVAFYEYGYTGKAISLTEQNLELLQSLEPIVKEKVEAGGDLNPLLRLKVEIGKISDRLKSFEQNREAQSAKISGILALSASNTLPWPEWKLPEAIELNLTTLLKNVVENNPDIAMLKQRVISAEARMELARLQNYPDFTLGFNYIQLGDPINPGVPDAGKDPWGFTVSVNIPIWVERNKSRRSDALSTKHALKYEQENKENILKAELVASHSRLKDANRRLDLYGDNLLKLARQSIDISKTSYEGGRTGILDVIDSERSLIELQLLYWRAAADAWQNRIIIQTLINQPILGSFKATSEK